MILGKSNENPAVQKKSCAIAAKRPSAATAAESALAHDCKPYYFV
jgi:hypothetical protein